MYEDNKKKGGGKKKGPAESKEQEKKDLLNDMPVDEVAGASKGKKHHKKDPKKPVARKKGGAQYKEEGGADHHKGGGKKKGAAGFNSHTSDTHKHPHPEGPSRMGFTQNFGPARQNSYAKGAAKVAKIMGKGAYKKGAADAGHGADPGHKHDRYISSERLKSNIEGSTSADMGMNLNEVVVTANNNNKKSNKKRKNPKVKSIYKKRVTGVNAPYFGDAYGKGGVFYSPTGYSRLNPVLRTETVKRSQKQIDRMRSRGITFKEDN